MAVKRKSQERSVQQCILVGTALGITLAVILSGVLTTLISNGTVHESMMKLGVIVILFLSSCSGCVLAAKLAKGKIALLCSVTGASYLVLLIGINIVFFDVAFVQWGSKLLAVIFGSVVACVLCAGGRKKRRTR